MLDPNFAQTTSLLSEFNKEGAMGVVLNRPLDITLSQIMGNEPMPGSEGIRTYWGGPVQNNIGWIIHEDASLAKESLEIEPNLYLSSSPNVLKRMVELVGKPDTPRFRFFLGYSGWGGGQLEQEMAAASWITAPLNRELIFDNDPRTLWKRSLASLGIDPMTLAGTPQGEAN